MNVPHTCTRRHDPQSAGQRLSGDVLGRGFAHDAAGDALGRTCARTAPTRSAGFPQGEGLLSVSSGSTAKLMAYTGKHFYALAKHMVEYVCGHTIVRSSDPN